MEERKSARESLYPITEVNNMAKHERLARDGVHPRAFGSRDPAADAPGGHPAADHRALLRGGDRPGMRVLDLGCGAADVSMLAAELVGPPDRSSASIATKMSSLSPGNRLRKQQLRKHRLRGGLGGGLFPDPEPFDAVIGRYVLIHQADPVALIRAAADLVRPGGVVAFHGPSVSADRSFNRFPASRSGSRPGNGSGWRSRPWHRITMRAVG